MNTRRSAAILAACSGLLASCGKSSPPPKPLPSRPGGQVAGPKVAPGATGAPSVAPAPKPETKPAESKPAETKPAETRPAAPTGSTGASGSTGGASGASGSTGTQPKPATPPGEPPVLKHTETDSGLIVEDLRWGTGEEAKPHDTVTIHYRGTFAVNGKTFDSSYDRNEPATFPLDRLIKGWQEGIPGMKVGSRRRLIVPPELGYGPKDVKQGNTVIPGGSMLVFDIELLAVKR